MSRFGGIPCSSNLRILQCEHRSRESSPLFRPLFFSRLDQGRAVLLMRSPFVVADSHRPEKRHEVLLPSLPHALVSFPSILAPTLPPLKRFRPRSPLPPLSTIYIRSFVFWAWVPCLFLSSGALSCHYLTSRSAADSFFFSGFLRTGEKPPTFVNTREDLYFDFAIRIGSDPSMFASSPFSFTMQLSAQAPADRLRASEANLSVCPPSLFRVRSDEIAFLLRCVALNAPIGCSSMAPLSPSPCA